MGEWENGGMGEWENGRKNNLSLSPLSHSPTLPFSHSPSLPYPTLKIILECELDLPGRPLEERRFSRAADLPRFPRMINKVRTAPRAAKNAAPRKATWKPGTRLDGVG